MEVEITGNQGVLEKEGIKFSWTFNPDSSVLEILVMSSPSQISYEDVCRKLTETISNALKF
jgi:hypothetical protein